MYLIFEKIEVETQLEYSMKKSQTFDSDKNDEEYQVNIRSKQK